MGKNEEVHHKTLKNDIPAFPCSINAPCVTARIKPKGKEADVKLLLRNARIDTSFNNDGCVTARTAQTAKKKDTRRVLNFANRGKLRQQIGVLLTFEDRGNASTCESPSSSPTLTTLYHRTRSIDAVLIVLNSSTSSPFIDLLSLCQEPFRPNMSFCVCYVHDPVSRLLTASSSPPYPLTIQNAQHGRRFPLIL